VTVQRRPKWQGWAKAAQEKLRQLTAGAHLPISAQVA
jgi:hypothetical protein